MISYIVFGLMGILLVGRRAKLTFSIALIACSCAFLYFNGEFFSSGEYGFLRGLVGFFSGYLVWNLSRLQFKLNSNLEYLIPLFLTLILYRLNLIENTSKEGLVFSMIAIPLFFSLSILCLLKTDGLLSKILDLKPIQFLGKISYSVYLNHAIINLVFPRTIFKIFKLRETTFNQILVFAITLAIVLLFSSFTYTYVEKKGGKFLRKLLLQKFTVHKSYELRGDK